MAPQTVIRVLHVTPNETDHVSLRFVLQHPNWQIHRAQNYQEARAFILQRPVSVVISEAALPDGNWKGILDDTRRSLDAPNLIVTSRLADDRLWAEVLNLGGWDVLSTPFEAGEVVRVLFAASLARTPSWRHPDSADSLEPRRLFAVAG